MEYHKDMQEILAFKNFKKYFGKIKAVDNISFSVKEGEIFGYLGPNGAGKTTTISCLMGFLFPTAGTIEIMGRDAIKDCTVLKKEIGYLSSDVHLYKNLTGQEHFDLVQAIKGKSPYLSRLVKDFSYNPKLKVQHLSTGNKQKLGIILCLMSQPKLLIMDEPTRGLDPLLQNIFYQHIADFKKNGTTIFMSSHNLSEVEKICDRIGIIKEGHLVAMETLESIKQKRIYMIRAQFNGFPGISIFKIKGVDEIRKTTDNSLEIKLKGEINDLLKLLSKFSLINLEINRASLEEVFMEYYQ